MEESKILLIDNNTNLMINQSLLIQILSILTNRNITEIEENIINEKKRLSTELIMLLNKNNENKNND